MQLPKTQSYRCCWLSRAQQKLIYKLWHWNIYIYILFGWPSIPFPFPPFFFLWSPTPCFSFFWPAPSMLFIIYQTPITAISDWRIEVGTQRPTTIRKSKQRLDDLRSISWLIVSSMLVSAMLLFSLRRNREFSSWKENFFVVVLLSFRYSGRHVVVFFFLFLVRIQGRDPPVNNLQPLW